MTTNINIESIREILGERFIVTAARTGSFKVDLAAMKNGQMKSQGITSDDKVTLFVEARKALTNAGHPATISDSYRDSQGQWRPWMCIWVNTSAQTTAATQTKLDNLTEQVAKLTAALLGNSDTEVDGDGDAVVENKDEEETVF